MKILRFAPYITNSKIPEHSERQTGFGRSVWDITRYSAKSGNEEFLYTFRNNNEKVIENVCLLEGKKINLIKNINYKTIIELFRAIPRVFQMHGNPWKIRLSYFLASSSYGYIEKLIKTVKPEIIHIHGLTYQTLPFIEAAKKSNIPYVVTLHGLNMNTVSNQLESNFEKKQISMLNKNNIYITIIGSGMLKTIKENCTLVNPKRIVTINHGIDDSTLNPQQNVGNIIRKMNLYEKKVLISVGSLIERKNHDSLIESISKLENEEKKKLIIFIIGEGPMRSKLEELIRNFDLNDTVFLVGQKNHIELSEYYAVADFSLLLSHIEGFGRPILESYYFGVPVITFNDLDAIEDLYVRNGMFIINERSSEAIASKIREVINLEISPAEMKNFAQSKTWDAAVLKYNEVYSNIL